MNRVTGSARLIACFTIPIAILVAICSGTGLLDPSLYAKETPNWFAQCLGQDIANLAFVLPALLLSAFFAAKGNKAAKIIWAGIMITNIYSYMIYCFAVHFNYLFHFYCLVLGLSIYAVICFAVQNRGSDCKGWFKPATKRMPASVTLILIGVLFSLLWLSETIPAILTKSVPEVITNAALPTNPVFVLDFSFYLPLLFISAVLLIKKSNLGYFLAPMMLMFSIITNVNIISLTCVDAVYNHSDQTQMLLVFSVFAIACAVVLAFFLKNIAKSKDTP